MRKERVFSKINNEKGLTGIDIVIAATIIFITITVVSMIYLNTTVESRNITRTAGATRIATNILENIEKLSYNQFLESFHLEIEEVTKIDDEKSEYFNYYLLDGGIDNQIFSTKIPKGYNLYMKCEPNYGSHTDTQEQFDLVRDIEIIIAFRIGDRTENVEFQTTKTREIIGETNSPVTDYLASSGILESGMNYYPVKYLDNSDVYVKVRENDSSWYNYSNKQWATVIVSKQAEEEIFDINGKFIGNINTKKDEETYTERFVWIPRFFTQNIEEDKNIFYSFAYLGKGNNKIVSEFLNSIAGSSSTLNIDTYAELTEEEILAGVKTETTNFQDKSGKWVSCEIDEKSGKTGIINDEDSNLLNSSKYGPYTGTV